MHVYYMHLLLVQLEHEKEHYYYLLDVQGIGGTKRPSGTMKCVRSPAKYPGTCTARHCIEGGIILACMRELSSRIPHVVRAFNFHLSRLLDKDGGRWDEDEKGEEEHL